MSDSSLYFIPILSCPLQSQKDGFPSSLQEHFTYWDLHLHIGRSVIACFLDICSCYCPLSEKYSELILQKFSAFNLLGLFEEAEDVKHSLAIDFLLVCIALQNKRDVSLWPWLLDSTITH